MKNYKPIQLLRLLNEEELRRLSKFLRSPYFNYSQAISALFEHLRKYHPDYSAKSLKPEKVWLKMFPEENYDDNKFWKLSTKFKHLIERFLAVEEIERNETQHKEKLIAAFGKRNAHALFEKETKLMVEQIESTPWDDILSYNKTLWLKHHYFFHPLTDKYGKAVFKVEDAMEDLDRFYMLAKLQFTAEMKNRERIFSKKTPIVLLEECIAESSKFIPDNPAFLIYQNTIDLYDPDKNKEAYYKGKELLEHHFSALSRTDQNEALLNLRNYTIRQLNKGESMFWKELLALYKMGLKLDLIVDNGKISEAAFTNIVRAGCREKEFEWAANFIQTHEMYLDEGVRGDASIMGYSVLYFQKKDYHKTLEYLSGYKFSQILHQVAAAILTVKTWFELYLNNKDLSDYLTAKIESSEKLIRRNKFITQQKKKENINFLLAVRQLSEFVLVDEKSISIKEKMERYLTEEKYMVSKKWLIEKINQL